MRKLGTEADNQMAANACKQVTEHIIRDEIRLISRILAGEGNLYYELIAPYERMVYVSAFSLLRNEPDAEDCTQDAFLKAFRHLSEFKGESKFGSWLVRITLNEAKMRLRKVGRSSMSHWIRDYMTRKESISPILLGIGVTSPQRYWNVRNSKNYFWTQ